MGVTFYRPHPGRHTAGSASWNETFGLKSPAMRRPGEVEVQWHGTAGKGVAQAHYPTPIVLNGLGLHVHHDDGHLPSRADQRADC